MSCSRKTTEIKFGRFLTTLIKLAKKEFDINFDINCSDIEKYHNNFILVQNGDYIKTEINSGEELREGYKSINYYKVTSSLGGSCMTNKTSYLDLYTNNDNVKMVVIKSLGSIVGRALLWKTTCGKELLDKEYTCEDWVIELFNKIRKENNYLEYSTEEKLSVAVNTENINDWPYLDTFAYLDREKKILSNFPNSDSIYQLRSQGGVCQSL